MSQFQFQRGSCAHNVPNKLVSSLFRQKKADRYCDIMLVFGEVQINAHACVVASFSPFVDNLLTTREVMPPCSVRAEAECPRLKLDVPLGHSGFTCLDCASKVIDFMYVGKIQIDDLHLEHIRAVSEGLQVSELLKICRRHSNKCSTEREETSVTAEPSELDVKARSVSASQSNGVSSSSQSDPDRLQKTSGLESTCASNTPVTGCDDVMDESEWSGMKCPKCDLVFLSLAKYQQHCSTHLGKTYTTCFVCNFASIRVPDVIKHLQEKAHGEKVCSLCLLEVSSSQLLKEHLQMHDQTHPFFCLTCNTRFQTRTALNSHIVRHTNETPFVCKECGRGFKWKHGLQSHMVTHSKLKTLLCDQCGFSTAHLKSFIDHKMMHSGEKFKCPKPDCQFESVRKESVKHHLMTHTKQKPYQCEICGQAFSQSKNLRRHAALHNPSADPERCPLCSFQTTRSDKFKAHFKRFHKDGEGEKCNKQADKKKKNFVNSEEIPLPALINNSRSSGDRLKRRRLKKRNTVSSTNHCSTEVVSELNPISHNKCLEESPFGFSKTLMFEAGGVLSENLDLSSIPTIIVNEVLVNETSSTSFVELPSEWSYSQILPVGYEDAKSGKSSNLTKCERYMDSMCLLQASSDQNTASNLSPSMERTGENNDVNSSALPGSLVDRDSPSTTHSNTENASAIGSPNLTLEANSISSEDIACSAPAFAECSISVLDFSATNGSTIDIPQLVKQFGDDSDSSCLQTGSESGIKSDSISFSPNVDSQLSKSGSQQIFILNSDGVSSPETGFGIPDGTYVILEDDGIKLPNLSGENGQNCYASTLNYSVITVNDPVLQTFNQQDLETMSSEEISFDTMPSCEASQNDKKV